MQIATKDYPALVKEVFEKHITTGQPYYLMCQKQIDSICFNLSNGDYQWAKIYPSWFYMNKAFFSGANAFQDDFEKFENMLAAGKSYLYGENMPMEGYLKKAKSSLTEWQKFAFEFCINNPSITLHFSFFKTEWKVYKRGEYVNFSLPFHDKGGEKDYVSLNGKTKYLINVD